MNDPEVKKYAQYAKDNNPEMFIKSLFPEKFKDIAMKLLVKITSLLKNYLRTIRSMKKSWMQWQKSYIKN